MGQGQSSAGGGATPDDAPAKTDYYELLGVERQATEDEYDVTYRTLQPSLMLLQNQESLPPESSGTSSRQELWQCGRGYKIICRCAISIRGSV